MSNQSSKDTIQSPYIYTKGNGQGNFSNSKWFNPIVGVRKASGKLRLYLDSRRLNSISKSLAFPLPYISRIPGHLRDTKYLSSLDLSDAFCSDKYHSQKLTKTRRHLPFLDGACTARLKVFAVLWMQFLVTI